MIKKLNIKSFGAIKNKEFCFGKNLNIVYGENEAGKSTIHEALRTLLFGFSPAKLEKHIYKPWDDSHIILEGEIDIKKDLLLRRKLGDRPEASVSHDGKIKGISNKPLEEIEHISKDVFKQVYALTLDDMSSLSDRSMELVFDGLVENYGLDFLNSPSEVIKEIQLKENAIYRENRRGNYRIKEIDGEIRVINSQIRDSEQSVDQYFKSKLELEEAQKEKNEMTSKLNEFRLLSDRISQLIDVVKMKKFLLTLPIEFNFMKYTYASLLDKLTSVKDLKNEIIKKEENLNLIDLEINQESLNHHELSDFEKEILRKRPNYIIVKNYVSKLSQIISEINFKEKLYSENLISRKALEKELFSRELSQSELKSLKSLDVISIRRFIEEESKKEDLIYKSNTLKKLTIPLLIFLCIIILLYFDFKQISYVLSILLGAIIMKNYKEYKFQREGLNFHDSKIELFFGELPLPRVFIEELDLNYFEKIFRLRDIESKSMDIKLEIEDLSSKKNEIWNKISLNLDDSRLLNENVSMETLNLVLDEFSNKIDDIKLKEINNKSSELRINGLIERQSAFSNEIDKIKAELNNKLKDISQTFNLDEELLNRLIIDSSSIVKACEVESEFNSIIDIESKLKEIEDLKKAGVEFSEEYISKIKISSNDLIEELNAIENKIGKLNEKIRNLYSLDSRNDLLSSLKRLRTEREELMIKKAILTTTRECIEDFDRDFKEENQPDILRYASKYFAIITNNKYTKVYMNRDTNELLLKSDHGEKIVDEGFSRGTKEQLYFCFRLAIIKHLSRDKEFSLPLIIDDIFVNWDLKRIESLCNLLIEISKDRQIIIFTCHKSQVDMFLDRELVKKIIL